MSPPPLFSVVTTCKGRLEHLKFTLPYMLAMGDCEVIVVDYDCPDHAGDWVRATHPGVRVVQVADRPFFNLAHARNLGIDAARAPWLLMVDADVIVAAELLEVLRAQLQLGSYLLPKDRPRQLMGFLAVGRAALEAVGGYDEAFQGYGSEDHDLIDRLVMAGGKAATFDGGFLKTLVHDDPSRTRFHEIPDLSLNQWVNELYRTAKMDLMRLGIRLGPEQARALYAGARAAVLAPDNPSKLEVNLPPKRLGGRALDVTFTYRLTANAPPPAEP